MHEKDIILSIALEAWFVYGTRDETPGPDRKEDFVACNKTPQSKESPLRCVEALCGCIITQDAKRVKYFSGFLH